MGIMFQWAIPISPWLACQFHHVYFTLIQVSTFKVYQVNPAVYGGSSAENIHSLITEKHNDTGAN